MATIIRFRRHHARASTSADSRASRFRAAISAKTLRVISDLPDRAAKATTAAQCGAGMPLVCQPLTVDADSPKAGAATPVPPRASMTDFQVTMPDTIVRNLRTCQAFATCETTFRKSHVEIPHMDTDHDIARRLVAVREHFKESQVDFAEKLNMAKNTLNGYETGKRPLTIEAARRIRDRFGISVDWLLFGDIGQPSHDLAIKLGPAPAIKADAKKAKQPGKRRRAS
jgi:transcriptional regulator with XRE-family HTH domain